VKRYCIAERDRARFVAQMEEVLDVYAAEPQEDCPLVCMDEAAKQLLGDLIEPLPIEPAVPAAPAAAAPAAAAPAAPGESGGQPQPQPQSQQQPQQKQKRAGKPKREDYHYDRNGVRSIFMFFAPHRGWRRVASSARRTRVDWARQIRQLLDEDFPQAQRITLLCDNLNTHAKASLYEAFAPAEAHRLASKLNIVYTPRNGSWLNVAEIELSILAEQCLKRRLRTAEDLDRELGAWNIRRNRDASKLKWHFTTADARIKLRRLYPTI
jgi:hypothetical protein